MGACCEIPEVKPSYESDGTTERKVDDRENECLDIYVSTLGTSAYPFKDIGIITSTYALTLTGVGQQSSGDWRQDHITRLSQGTEKVRNMALAGLRKKCKQVGGNAILDVKFDVEVIGYDRLCVATGTAVIMEKNQLQKELEQFEKLNYKQTNETLN